MDNKLPPGTSELDWLWDNYGPELDENGQQLTLKDILTAKIKEVSEGLGIYLVDLKLETNPTDHSQWRLFGITGEGIEIPLTFQKANPLINVELIDWSDPNDCCNKIGEKVLKFQLLDGSIIHANLEVLSNIYKAKSSDTITLAINNNEIFAEVRLRSSTTIELSDGTEGIRADVIVGSTQEDNVQIISGPEGLKAKLNLTASKDAFDIEILSEDSFRLKQHHQILNIGTIYFIEDKGYIVYNEKLYGATTPILIEDIDKLF